MSENKSKMQHYLLLRLKVERGIIEAGEDLPYDMENYTIGEGWVRDEDGGRRIRDSLMDYGDFSWSDVDEIDQDLAEAIISEQERTGQYDVIKHNPELKAFALKSMNTASNYYSPSYFD